MRASLVSRSMGNLIPPKIATPSSLVRKFFNAFFCDFAENFSSFVTSLTCPVGTPFTGPLLQRIFCNHQSGGGGASLNPLVDFYSKLPKGPNPVTSGWGIKCPSSTFLHSFSVILTFFLLQLVSTTERTPGELQLCWQSPVSGWLATPLTINVSTIYFMELCRSFWSFRTLEAPQEPRPLEYRFAFSPTIDGANALVAYFYAIRLYLLQLWINMPYEYCSVAFTAWWRR